MVDLGGQGDGVGRCIIRKGIDTFCSHESKDGLKHHQNHLQHWPGQSREHRLVHMPPPCVVDRESSEEGADASGHPLHRFLQHSSFLLKVPALLSVTHSPLKSNELVASFGNLATLLK